MIIANENFSNMINSPVRRMAGRVELFKGSALELICGCHDNLKSFTIERAGEDGKFFGFGVCHRINAHLIDPQRSIDVSTENTLEVEYGVGSDYIYPYPNFYITEVNRDELTNELSITGYDALYRATEHTVSELDILEAYTIKDFAIACATVLGIPVNLGSMADSSFNLYYEAGANFEGTENIREALNAVAEATQTIYYINNNWELTFKRLDRDGAVVATIDKAKYIELDSKTNRRLTNVVSATELGDNITGTLKAFATGEAININNVISVIDTQVKSKNIIYSPYFNVTGTVNGVTYTVNADGSITANGTATENAFFYMVQSYKIPAGTYTLSSINLTANNELRCAIYNTDNTLDRYVYNGTFTINSEKLVYIYLVIAKGNTVNNVTYKPILELGTKATEYTPFIADLTKVKVTANGTEYIPEANGIVTGIEATDTLTITTDAIGALIDVNYYAVNGLSGTTQYIRNNPFWELREDITELVDNALATVNGLTINQFNCNWRGNYLLEIGDKIALVTKDNENVISYLLNDTTSFDGSLSQKSQWEYTDNEGETASNPSTLGEALKLTYARVDKINKEIEIVASDISANSEQISRLQMTTDNIAASVGNTESKIDDVNNNINTLTSKVNAAITAEDVTIAIQTELENGVNKVVTETGYTFNEDGLTVTKSGSEMETTISEDGMVVSKDNKEVLVADNKGVTAIDLKATTYLIVGDNSRFEDYGSSRTGCFWIG